MSAASPQRAVVVDDSASAVAQMIQLLERIDGCQAIGFTVPSKALAWCLETDVDLVIVDYEMPSPNGIAFIEAFRSDPSRDAIPVVMVTSTEDRDIRYMALQIGATDFLAKPIDPLEFTARMRNLLASARAHKSLAEMSVWLTDEVRKTSLVLKQSPASVMITDRDGLIDYVNPKFTEMTGYRPEEVIGRSPAFLKSEFTTNDLDQELWGTITAGREWRGTLYNRRKDGGYFWESALISPIRDAAGEITHFVGIMEDITERKKLEMELIGAKEHAETANQAKAQFLALMSHELRTPLNAIIGFSELIASDRDQTRVIEEYAGYCKIISECGKSLLSNLDDILKLTTISSRDLCPQTEPLPTSLLIKAALRTVQSRAEAACIRLVNNSRKALPSIIGDEAALHDALVRILLNGIKFSKPGGQVELQSRADDDGHLVIVISDDGIGIAPGDIERVQAPFNQANGALNRRFEGTGVGLSLAKRLVEHHGGTLKLESTVGVGTTVSIRIPPERIIAVPTDGRC